MVSWSIEHFIHFFENMCCWSCLTFTNNEFMWKLTQIRKVDSICQLFKLYRMMRSFYRKTMRKMRNETIESIILIVKCVVRILYSSKTLIFYHAGWLFSFCSVFFRTRILIWMFLKFSQKMATSSNQQLHCFNLLIAHVYFCFSEQS